MTELVEMSLDNDGGGDGDGQGRRRIHLREISGDSESPLETVGQDLRAARLRRGDEIVAVSRALKIRKDHLEALENDRLEDLPGKTYAIGFVRSYARHLGLDSTLYVERFKQEISGRPEESSREPAPIHQEEGRRLPQGWRIIGIVLVALLVYGGYRLLYPGGAANQPVPPAPVLYAPKPAAPPKAAPVPVPAQTAVPSPAADDASGAAPAAGPQADAAMPPPAAGPKSPATKLSPPGTQMTQPGQQTAAVGPAVPTAGGAQVYGKMNVGARVILRARADTRITVRAEDGSLLLNRDLKAGDIYQVPNMPGVTMATSDAGAVELNLDGTALGQAGQQGQILGRVSLDPQSLGDRYNSH